MNVVRTAFGRERYSLTLCFEALAVECLMDWQMDVEDGVRPTVCNHADVGY